MRQAYFYSNGRSTSVAYYSLRACLLDARSAAGREKMVVEVFSTRGTLVTTIGRG